MDFNIKDLTVLFWDARVEIGVDNILLTMPELSQNTCWKVIGEIFVSVIYTYI